MIVSNKKNLLRLGVMGAALTGSMGGAPGGGRDINALKCTKTITNNYVLNVTIYHNQYNYLVQNSFYASK